MQPAPAARHDPNRAVLITPSVLPLLSESRFRARLTLLAAACTWHCRRPLLPLWCLAVYDLLRRALDAGGGRVTTALSLRQGEAAVLAHAVALWTVDAALFTIQEVTTSMNG